MLLSDFVELTDECDICSLVAFLYPILHAHRFRGDETLQTSIVDNASDLLQ